MTCPTNQRRIEPDGTVLVCDVAGRHVVEHYDSDAGVLWYDGDRWSWSATCRTCEPQGALGLRMARDVDGDTMFCPACGGTGVDPPDLVRLDPWVGARLSWKGDDEDVRVTRLAGDYDEDDLLTVLHCEMKQFVNVKRSDVDPDVGPWRVIARPAKDTP